MARILIIDDEPVTRAMVEEMLKLADHETVSAADGIEGLKQFLARPSDLVITDLFMPEKDGLEVIKELRMRFPKVAIIAISGKPIAGKMLSVAHTLGAVEVLQKPFTSVELLSIVEKVLRNESVRSERNAA
jgi:CheY-like chemotaxis protein